MNKLAKMSESILTNSDSSVNDKIAEYIIYIVPRYLHIEETFHQTKNRKRELVIGRQLAMWLMRRYTGLSLDKIGDYFSRDHATVLHAKKHIDDLRETDKVIKKQLTDLKNIVTLKSKSLVHKVDLDNDFYYIDLNDFVSIRMNSNKAIIVTGFTDQEVEALKWRIKESFEVRNHTNTGTYILEQKTKS